MRAAERARCCWDRHPALATDPADVSRDAVTSGRLLIVDCHEAAAAAQAARFARDAGIPTIIDVEKVRPAIAELLQQIDAIIAAQEFPTALTGARISARRWPRSAASSRRHARVRHAR